MFQSFPVIQCASGIEPPPPDDPEALAATLRAAAPRFAKDITADDLTTEADDCAKLVGDAKPVALSYTGDGPIVVVGGTNDPATPIRWAQKMVGELGPNARLVTFTGEGHGQLLVSTCVTDIEGSLLADLKLPGPDTVCDPDPVVEKPDWWDALPVPDGISDVASLPALAAALGATPTQVFSEMRTTSLSAEDAVAAYTDVLSSAGFEQFDAAGSCRSTTSRRARTATRQRQHVRRDRPGAEGLRRRGVAERQGRCAAQHHGGVDHRHRQLGDRTQPGLEPSACHSSARRRSDRGGCSWLVTITPSIMSPTIAAHGRPFSCTEMTAPLATRRSERSTPAIRGGQRNPGATKPRRRTSRPMVRAALAKSREVLLTGIRAVSRRGVTPRL